MNSAIAHQPPEFLRCGRYTFDASVPRVIGILNVTPDSFSDGGRFLDVERAVAHALRMHAEGADVIDVGGESTRPGAAEVPADEELRRILPVVEGIVAADVAVSVDTSKPEVMRAALAAGASMINDVRALRAPGAVEAVARTQAGICLMHMQGEPRTMQHAPFYLDVSAEVREFLLRRAQACIDAGVDRDRILIDPGIGFGKDLAQNLALLNALPDLACAGFPVLVGWSRKSSLARIIGRQTGDRLAASIGAALAAVAQGAAWVRVHDVRETVDALAVWCAARAGRLTARRLAATDAAAPDRTVHPDIDTRSFP